MRDTKIDFLRFLGLSLIILAHVQPPPVLFTLRNFDVPLMVLISGVSFTLSKNKTTYLQYVSKRFNRLVLPTWTFLFLYFLISFIIGNRSSLQPGVILTSFTLTSGIGYVWIIRVFFITALIAPLIKAFNDKTTSNAKYLLSIFAIAVANEILIELLLKHQHFELIQYFLLTIWDAVTYALFFAIGIRFSKLKVQSFIAIGLISFIIFIGYGFFYYHQLHHVAGIQSYKYPPTFYYLSYGLLASVVWWFLAEYILRIKAIIPVVQFIGQNTLWIYFWHIVYLNIVPTTLNYGFRYILIYSLALASYFTQYQILLKFVLPKLRSQQLSKYGKMLLIG